MIFCLPVVTKCEIITIQKYFSVIILAHGIHLRKGKETLNLCASEKGLVNKFLTKFNMRYRYSKYQEIINYAPNKELIRGILFAATISRPNI